MRSLIYTIISLIILGGALSSCQESDDVGPIITLIGPDSVRHVLNVEYVDQGATATDETDGNVTDKIFVNNTVNMDIEGEYIITYSVVDEAGNEAQEVYRKVVVYNTAEGYTGDYIVSESSIPPNQVTCEYPAFVWTDSTVNNRIILYDFACNSERPVFANISDTAIVLPYQLIQDSTIYMSVQGSGFINDSTIFFEYQKIDSVTTSYWNVYFSR